VTGVPPVSRPGRADGSFTVHLKRRGVEFVVPAGTTLYAALRAAGVDHYASCMEGTCSNCLAHVLAGPIDHRDRVLTRKERERGDRIITCVSRGLPGTRLVLDL
jgi:ferredoxin